MELVLGTNRAFIQPGNQPPQDQSTETTGWGREKGGWQAVNGTKRESEGVVYMTLKKLCARDCLCSSTQLQMSPGFLPPPLSPPFSQPLTHSLSLTLTFTLFCLPLFLSVWAEWKGICVTGSGHQFKLTTHALSQKQKHSLIKQKGAGERSSLSNQKITLDWQVEQVQIQRKISILKTLLSVLEVCTKKACEIIWDWGQMISQGQLCGENLRAVVTALSITV